MPIRARLFSISLAILALDQLTKWIVVQKVPLHGEVTVIPRFFSISHVLNKGAAFSLFAQHETRATMALAIFSALVMAAISYFLWKRAEPSRIDYVLAIILGGAAGNFIDRVRLRAVVDFLAFDFGSYHWPDFNLADSAIVIGSLLLAFDALFGKHQPAAE